MFFFIKNTVRKLKYQKKTGLINMGNEILKCCYNCMKIQPHQQIPQTRYIQIFGTTLKNRFIKCKKYFISTENLSNHRLNQLIIFTDKNLSIEISNSNIKLKQGDVQKLQQALIYEMQNNNLTVREDCFVLNVIEEEEEDSQYEEFKDFPQNLENQENQENYFNLEQKKMENQESINNIQQIIMNKQNKSRQKQDKRNQIQQFALRTKSRAFRFKNPLKDYPISQIIVAIIPVFDKNQDLVMLKQAIQQALSMVQDQKIVGMFELSYLMGYKTQLFQKIILEYLLGYSKAKKDYVFKRIHEFFYISDQNEHLKSFINLLNIYTKNENEKGRQVNRRVTKTNEKKQDKNNNEANIGHRQIFKKTQNKQNQTNEQNIQLIKQKQNHSILNESSFHNSSFYSFSQRPNLRGLNVSVQQKDKSNNKINNESNILDKSERFFVSNVSDITNPYENQISSINFDNSEINNIRLKSFRSKESNASDYF